jgi:hypothetical protein
MLEVWRASHDIEIFEPGWTSDYFCPMHNAMADGKITSVDPWQVFFNHASIYEMPHMILAAYAPVTATITIHRADSGKAVIRTQIRDIALLPTSRST